jgi:hypothetical protein
MKRLKFYKAIGWDMDETLINHPQSQMFWDFIMENPFGQDHHIVTFRSGGMEKSIFSDFCRVGSNLTQAHFRAVHNVDNNTWYEFYFGTTGLVIPGQPDPYMDWKAKTCVDKGIDVLIDDMQHIVAPGCARLGIKFYHPDELEPL